MDWGEGLKKSTDKADAVGVPVALLVNGQTVGAAEAFAAILRYADVGLVIGTNTAGQASLMKEFVLKSGQRLRVAVAPLKLGEGRELPLTGLKPDIQVDVSAEDERAWYEDSFKAPARSVTLATQTSSNDFGTNRTPRRRMNEAELVRMNREGRSAEPVATNSPTRPPETTPPVVTDPALVRALDLLKGLAVVQQFRAR